MSSHFIAAGDLRAKTPMATRSLKPIPEETRIEAGSFGNLRAAPKPSGMAFAMPKYQADDAYQTNGAPPISLCPSKVHMRLYSSKRVEGSGQQFLTGLELPLELSLHEVVLPPALPVGLLAILRKSGLCG